MNCSMYIQLDEMDQLFESYKPPKFTKEEIDNPSNPFCIKVIEFIVKNLKMKIVDKTVSLVNVMNI